MNSIPVKIIPGGGYINWVPTENYKPDKNDASGLSYILVWLGLN